MAGKTKSAAAGSDHRKAGGFRTIVLIAITVAVRRRGTSRDDCAAECGMGRQGCPCHSRRRVLRRRCADRPSAEAGRKPRSDRPARQHHRYNGVDGGELARRRSRPACGPSTEPAADRHCRRPGACISGARQGVAGDAHPRCGCADTIGNGEAGAKSSAVHVTSCEPRCRDACRCPSLRGFQWQECRSPRQIYAGSGPPPGKTPA